MATLHSLISRYFDYPDGVGLDEYKPGKISRFYL